MLPLSDVCWLIKPMNYSFNSPTKHSLPRNQTIVTPPIRHSYWSYVHQLNDILNRPHHPPHPKHGTGEFCSASQLSVVQQIASPYPTLSDSAPCSESLPTVISWALPTEMVIFCGINLVLGNLSIFQPWLEHRSHRHI